MSQFSHKPRIAVEEAATLSRGADYSVPCTILDVSKEGFRLRVSGAVLCGGGYVLRYNCEDHPVEIRWANMGEAGGLFQS